MKVTYRQTGGFAGLVLGYELDTDTLKPEEAKAFKALLESANLGKLKTKRAPKARDLTGYEITIEDKGTKKTIRLNDMSLSKESEGLIEYLQKRSKAVPIK
jgi:hypothetical protein